jgi:hypothetical protein
MGVGKSIINDHKSSILIKQTTNPHVNIHIHLHQYSKLKSNSANIICQEQTNTLKWSKWPQLAQGIAKSHKDIHKP